MGSPGGVGGRVGEALGGDLEVSNAGFATSRQKHAEKEYWDREHVFVVSSV